MQPDQHLTPPVLNSLRRQASPEAGPLASAAKLSASPLWRNLEEVAQFVGAPSSLPEPVELVIPLADSATQARLLTASAKMREVLQLAQRLAQTDWPILIYGETGTGKELLARLIHQWSARSSAPFLAVNCAALPETLAESEIFGYERGSYTGAGQARPGYFEQANGGTLVLDEVSELPWSLQGKLLRVLEDQQVYRLGATRPRPVSVRLLALSNRPLETLVKQHRFRLDLLHRLSVLQLDLPPLRQRPEDIPLLAKHYLQLACTELERRPLEFSIAALQALQDHSWPGNVRQLRNVVWQTVLRIPETEGVILPEHLSLPATIGNAAAHAAIDPAMARHSQTVTAQEFVPTFHQTEATSSATGALLCSPSLRLAEIERLAITEALRRTSGHRRRAAQLLGISLRTLFNKLRQYHLVSAK